MDNCKNTRFSSYNQYNHLLGVCTYRRELETTQVMRLSQNVEDRLEDIQELIKDRENEIVYDVLEPISTKCQVSFLNPVSEGSAKNPRIFELPVGGMTRHINNGFHKIIQCIPNKGIVGLKCFSEDGQGGFLVPHENTRNNLYIMATPHSNEHIELVWSELNGLWFVLNYSGHFENVNPNDLGGSVLNIQEPSVASSMVDQDIDDSKIPSASGWKNRTDTYTLGPSGEYLDKIKEQKESNDDSSTTPTDSSTTPADSSTTPTDSSTTPTDSSTTPADSSTTPADSSTTPTDSSTTPAETDTDSKSDSEHNQNTVEKVETHANSKIKNNN
jgi:hypothetical protein